MQPIPLLHMEVYGHPHKVARSIILLSDKLQLHLTIVRPEITCVLLIHQTVTRQGTVCQTEIHLRSTDLRHPQRYRQLQ